MSMRACTAVLILALLPLPALCTTPSTTDQPTTVAAAASPSATPGISSGREVYASFREGLADPACDAGVSTRWRQHFAHVPRQLAGNNEVLPLFGYVVDALREADLPTEYALIPFVESGYKPGARSASGPAGLWQFIAVTARNHKIAIRPGYDGRLSPVDSTQAAVRYLKTLHGMFAGDWRLAVMAFNAGEYRVFGALKRHGQRAMDADPAQLASLSSITQSYVRKLHALSCVLAEADDREDWLRALDRPVPRLAAVELPADAGNLDAWSARAGQDATLLKRLNPALAVGRIAGSQRVLAAATGGAALTQASNTGGTATPALPALLPPPDPTPVADAAASTAASPPSPRTHVVARGESASRIAQRHGISLAELLRHNGLGMRSILRPGMVLRLDDTPTPAALGNPAASAVAN
jgi:membrane-bound lytic murein transglycosylase D